MKSAIKKIKDDPIRGEYLDSQIAQWTQEDLYQWRSDINMETVTGIKRRTFQKWRLEGGGPLYMKVNSLVRYRLVDSLSWAQDQLCASTSESSVGGMQNEMVQTHDHIAKKPVIL